MKLQVHGTNQRRERMKAHVAGDAASQEVMDVQVPESGTRGAQAFPVPVERSPKSVKRVLADGAYSERSCRNFLYENGIEPQIPLH